MNRKILIKSRVGADGVLHISVPIGESDAHREVQVTVEPTTMPALSQEEWRRWVESVAGRISDPSFRRHEQGELEEREALS